MTIITVIYYITSIASIFLYILSVQFKEKKNILLTQIFSSICYLIVYAIKGAWFGVIVEVLNELKGFSFIKLEKNNKKIPFWVLLVFLILLNVVTIIFYDGILSLIPLVINILLYVSTYYKNPKHIRNIMFLCGGLWVVFNMYVGAYLLVVGNVLGMISALIAIIKYKNDDDNFENM